MALADKVGKKSEVKSTATNSNIEGNELAIALQSSAMQQAESMAGLLQAYDNGMIQNAELVADAFASRLNGEHFAGLVMEKVAEKSAPIEQPQTLEVPAFELPVSPLDGVKDTFAALFGSGEPRKALTFADLTSEGDSNG